MTEETPAKKPRTKKKPAPAPIKRVLKGSAVARRNAARLAAVQCLYQMQQSKIDAEQALADYVHHRYGIEEEGQLFVAADVDLLRTLVMGVDERDAMLQEMLEKIFTEGNRPFVRQELLVQLILKTGAEEIFSQLQTETALIISSYVDVGKAFYADRTPTMINAVLDKIAKTIRTKTA
ncbi:MAG TPA: transcription antitermination factor NusB [Alphaproteobacteria bacterium]